MDSATDADAHSDTIEIEDHGHKIDPKQTISHSKNNSVYVTNPTYASPKMNQSVRRYDVDTLRNVGYDVMQRHKTAGISPNSDRITPQSDGPKSGGSKKMGSNTPTDVRGSKHPRSPAANPSRGHEDTKNSNDTNDDGKGVSTSDVPKDMDNPPHSTDKHDRGQNRYWVKARPHRDDKISDHPNRSSQGSKGFSNADAHNHGVPSHHHNMRQGRGYWNGRQQERYGHDSYGQDGYYDRRRDRNSVGNRGSHGYDDVSQYNDPKDDLWDTPTDLTGCDSIYTLGDIRTAQRDIESGVTSLEALINKASQDHSKKNLELEAQKKEMQIGNSDPPASSIPTDILSSHVAAPDFFSDPQNEESTASSRFLDMFHDGAKTTAETDETESSRNVKTNISNMYNDTCIQSDITSADASQNISLFPPIDLKDDSPVQSVMTASAKPFSPLYQSTQYLLSQQHAHTPYIAHTSAAQLQKDAVSAGGVYPGSSPHTAYPMDTSSMYVDAHNPSSVVDPSRHNTNALESNQYLPYPTMGTNVFQQTGTRNMANKISGSAVSSSYPTYPTMSRPIVNKYNSRNRMTQYDNKEGLMRGDNQYASQGSLDKMAMVDNSNPGSTYYMPNQQDRYPQGGSQQVGTGFQSGGEVYDASNLQRSGSGKLTNEEFRRQLFALLGKANTSTSTSAPQHSKSPATTHDNLARDMDGSRSESGSYQTYNKSYSFNPSTYNSSFENQSFEEGEAAAEQTQQAPPFQFTSSGYHRGDSMDGAKSNSSYPSSYMDSSSNPQQTPDHRRDFSDGPKFDSALLGALRQAVNPNQNQDHKYFQILLALEKLNQRSTPHTRKTGSSPNQGIGPSPSPNTGVGVSPSPNLGLGGGNSNPNAGMPSTSASHLIEMLNSQIVQDQYGTQNNNLQNNVQNTIPQNTNLQNTLQTTLQNTLQTALQNTIQNTNLQGNNLQNNNVQNTPNSRNQMGQINKAAAAKLQQLVSPAQSRQLLELISHLKSSNPDFTQSAVSNRDSGDHQILQQHLSRSVPVQQLRQHVVSLLHNKHQKQMQQQYMPQRNYTNEANNSDNVSGTKQQHYHHQSVRPTNPFWLPPPPQNDRSNNPAPAVSQSQIINPSQIHNPQIINPSQMMNPSQILTPSSTQQLNMMYGSDFQTPSTRGMDVSSPKMPDTPTEMDNAGKRSINSEEIKKDTN